MPSALAPAQPPALSAPPGVHRTRLTARLDPAAHTIQGEGEIHWTNRSEQPTSEVWWHLYLNAFQHAQTAFLRARLGEGRGGQLPATWGDIKLTRLTVRAPSEPAALARWRSTPPATRRIAPTCGSPCRPPAPRGTR
jgi:hypothetical protein